MYLNIDYAYFMLTVPFLMVWLGLYWLGSKKTRKHQLLRSIIAAPMGPVFELFYFRDYWQPVSIMPVKIFSITIMPEDLLFAFAVAGIGSVSYEVFFNKTRTRVCEISASRKLLTFAILMFVVICVTIGLCRLGLNSIFATELALLFLAIPMVAIRLDLLRPALFTSLFFFTVLAAIYSLGFLCITNSEEILRRWWLLRDHALGLRLWRLPVTELVWALVYGFCCQLIYPAATKVRFE